MDSRPAMAIFELLDYIVNEVGDLQWFVFCCRFPLIALKESWNGRGGLRNPSN